MYAHQVIDALKYMYKVPYREKGRIIVEADVSEMPFLIEKIINSQKFHIGNVDSFLNTFSGDNKSMISLTDPLISSPPYNLTWVDGYFNWGKIGFLVDISGKNGVHLHFQRLNGQFWQPADHMSIFSLENDFDPYIEKLWGMPDEMYGRPWKFCFYAYILFNKLLACKNIGAADNEPPAKLNKARAKKGKQPLFTYKILVIKPTSKRQQSLEAQGLWENRIHLCRGHFKEYTGDKPLFGKYTGRYWWQPAVRGRNRDGVVMKDYEVKPTA